MNRLHSWICRSEKWRRTLGERLPWVLAGADLGSNPLELGPGPGLTTDVLRTKVPRLTAIEIDPRWAASLNARLGGGNVEVVTADATVMPFGNCRFSGAVCLTMLHHVPSRALQDRLLQEVWRVLEPGAPFVGCDSLLSLRMRILHIGDTLVPSDPDTFGTRLETAGFEVLKVEQRPEVFRFHARRPAIRNPVGRA
jgi:SAM-dependent methyltransferase